MNGITGVTMRSGARVPFSVPGGQVTNDTLYGIGQSGQLLLPTDSVASVWKPGRSTARTVTFTVGVIGLAVAASYIAMFGSSVLSYP
jgi:hypothetical protein